MQRDLVKCGIEQDWHELAQGRSAWHGVVEMSVDTINKEAEQKKVGKQMRGREHNSDVLLQAWLGSPVTIQTAPSQVATGLDL